jgi:hypothetical protein
MNKHNIIKSSYQKIKNNKPAIFIIGTFFGIILSIIFTPLFQSFFAQYYFNLDTEKPEFISY